MTTLYFKVKKDKNKYLGNRFFKWTGGEDKIVQVCVIPGEITKKGRGHTIGAYYISKQTFASNYFVMDYIEPTTKKQFEKEFNKVVEFLK